MAEAAGTKHPENALQSHLGQLHLTTPQQQQLTVGALWEGVAARDPAWVVVLVRVVRSSPGTIRQHLAAQPGLLKDLAAYVAHIHLSSNSEEASQQPPAAALSAAGSDTARSSSSKRGQAGTGPPSDEAVAQQQQQQRDSSSIFLAEALPPSSSPEKLLEAAAEALAHLLDCCEGCVAPPPYQDLAPALHAALQQRLMCLPELSGAFLRHHSSSMVTDQQLLGLVLEAAEQGEAQAAHVLGALAPKVLQVLEHSPPAYKKIHDRVAALLAGGTAAGDALMGAAMQQGGTLWQVQGMVEAACSGLLAACREAAAAEATVTSSNSGRGPKDEDVCWGAFMAARDMVLQYLSGLVDVALHLATHPESPLSSRLAQPAGPLVPALAEALSLLLQSPLLPASEGRRCQLQTNFGQRHGRYHDAAWSALLALDDCPQAAALVAALFQHRPVLLQALAASWDRLRTADDYYEESAGVAESLVECLLLSDSIPGQEERRQHKQLLVAGVRLLNYQHMEDDEFWRDRADQLMGIIRLAYGPEAVVRAPELMWSIFSEGILGPEQKGEGYALLLASPEFGTRLVKGLRQCSAACLAVVEGVLVGGEPAHTQALLAMPGLGDALALCCSRDLPCDYGGFTVDHILSDALDCQHLQAYLSQQPVLLQALLERLRLQKGDASMFWEYLAYDDSGDEWLLHQPAVLDGVVAALVVADSSCVAYDSVERLLEVAPTLVCESLLRQPSALEDMLRTLVLGYWQPQPSGSAINCDAQLLLLKGVASSQLAPRALALLPGLLAKGNAELSAGVFEAINMIQSSRAFGSGRWCKKLAATSSRGAPVLCAEGQLQALRQGVGEVQRATAAAAAARQQLQEQHQIAVAAAGASSAAGECFQGRSRQGSSRLKHDCDSGVQQQGQQGSQVQQEGGSSSSQRKGSLGRKAAAGQRAVSGRGAGGRRVPGKASSAPAVAAAGGGPGGSEVAGAEAPPARKRTRR